MRKFFIFLLILIIGVGILLPVSQSQAKMSLMEGISPQCKNNGTCSLCDMLVVVHNVAKLIFVSMSAIALIMLLVAGIGLILNMGNMQTVATNKKIITNTVIAVVIIMVAWTIVNFTIYTLVGKEPNEKLNKEFWSTEYWYNGPSCK